MQAENSAIDAFYRIAYRFAYQGALVYWRVFRPPNRGALVALWHQGRVLLVKNSYVDHYSLPGGNLRKDELPVEAAVRELVEEIHLKVEPEQLAVALDHQHQWKGRSDHVVIFELELDHEPTIRVDNREVVSAEWLLPEEALKRYLFPPLRMVIEDKLKGPRDNKV